MKCKRCGAILTANTLRRCPTCAEEKEKLDAERYAGEFGIINRAFDIAVMPLKLDIQFVWISVPLVVVLTLIVAVFATVYAVLNLPVRRLIRRITEVTISR